MAETLTTTVLYAGVAANVDLTSADITTTVDVDDEIKQWALEGVDFMATVVADYALESYVNASTAAAQTNGVTFPTAAMKVIRVVETSGSEARYVQPAEFTNAKNLFAAGSRSYGAGAQIWSLVDNSIEVFRTATTIDIHYIPIAAWVGASEPYSLSIPNGWSGLVIDYCTVKMKMREEETQQAQQLWQMFIQGLQRYQGFGDLQETVGG